MEKLESVHEEEAERGGRTGFWLALLVMLAICLFALYRSALFRLERVQITGNARLSQVDIMEIAGLRPGMLRWEAPTVRVQERLAAEPWVASAKVSWNGNRLLIEVTEREPLALLHYQGHYYLLLDETGRILGQQILEQSAGLPVISGPVVTQALRGQQLSDLGLQDALSVVAWTAPDLRAKISEVQVREDRNIRFFMDGGATVNWGVLPEDQGKHDEFIQGQLRLFGRFWDGVPRAKWATCQVDLRVPDTVRSIGCQ